MHEHTVYVYYSGKSDMNQLMQNLKENRPIIHLGDETHSYLFSISHIHTPTFYQIKMPIYLSSEYCTIMLNILPNVGLASTKLGDLMQQSLNGFILIIGMWQVGSDQNLYYANDLHNPNTYTPIVFPQEINNSFLIHVYCPNSTIKWEVRNLNDNQNPPTLCPNKWIEGHLKVPNLDQRLHDVISGKADLDYSAFQAIKYQLYADVLHTRLMKQDHLGPFFYIVLN